MDIVDPSDPGSIARVANLIPVRVSAQRSVAAYTDRVCEILRLLDIDATPHRGGIAFGGEGVPIEDQALLYTVTHLAARRFGVPDAW
jgi:hypothetical protein